MRSLTPIFRTLTRTLLPLVALCLASGCLAEVDGEQLAHSQDALVDDAFMVLGDEEGPDPTPWVTEDELSGPDPTPWHDLDPTDDEQRIGDVEDGSGPDPTPWRSGGRHEDEEPDPQPWHQVGDTQLEADLQ